MNEIIVLFNGYSYMKNDLMIANCTCTLIKSNDINIIVDTMTAWDRENILKELEKHDIKPEAINFVVNTHGHSDHIGNNNLFLNAQHIVGDSISNGNVYILHDFKANYKLNDDIEIIKTPGHTPSCVTVFVKNTNFSPLVAIAGDLFERAEDVFDETIWMEAGSFDEFEQKKNRSLVAAKAHHIIPGHGPIFEVTEQIRTELYLQYINFDKDSIRKKL